MNKLNTLSKLAIAGIAGAVSAVGIVTTPAEASRLTPESSIGWQESTSSFAPEVNPSDPIAEPPDEFTVTFSNDNNAIIQGPSGDFDIWFNDNQNLDPFPAVTVTFIQREPADDTPPTNAVYRAVTDFEFDFTDSLPDGAAKPDGTELTELRFIVPEETQFLLDTFTPGTDAAFNLCFETCVDRPYWLVNGKRNDARTTFNFQDLGGGTPQYGVVSVITGVPEPGTILGLLAISGLGLGLKRKKQS